MKIVSGLFLLATLSACATVPAPGAADFPEDFFSGNYALIGQQPDGGATYRGTASIAQQAGAFTLIKIVGGKSITAQGSMVIASPGGGRVLKFTWPGHQETCLPQSDLDNYGRLSCYWIDTGATHRRPGLESYFSSAGWN